MKAEPKQKARFRRILVLLGKILGGILIFLLLLILFIRSPWGQDIIINKLINYIEDTAGAEISVDKAFVSFSGNFTIEGLYIEDQKGDTLVYSKLIETDIELLPLVRRTGVNIENLEWSGVQANIYRADTTSGFNYEFLMEAFSAPDTATTKAVTDSTAPMEISIEDVHLRDFRLRFEDQISGIQTKINLGKLEVLMEEFDLDSMKFNVGSATLANTRFSYTQSEPLMKEEKDTAPGLMPNFSVETLQVNNVIGNYHSLPDHLFADVGIDKLILELPKADLNNQEVIIERLALKNSHAFVDNDAPEQNSSTSQPETASESFEWPEWKITAEEISLGNNDFRFTLRKETPEKAVFNPGAIKVTDFDFQSNHLSLKPGSLEAFVQKLEFREYSGLQVSRLNFDLQIDEKRLRLHDLDLKMNDNALKGELVLRYPSVDSLLNYPEQTVVQVDVPSFFIDLNDLFLVQPSLEENQYLKSLGRKTISGSLAAQGTLSEIQVKKANAQWGGQTEIRAQGTVFNVTDPEQIRFDFPKARLVTNRTDLVQLVDEEALGVKIPQQIRLSGAIQGKPEDLFMDIFLTSSAGEVSFTGNIQTSPSIAITSELSVDNLHLGQLLQNPSLGPITLEASGTGSGASISNLDARLKGIVKEFLYSGYKFQDLTFYSELENGEGFANLDYEDENLNVELESAVALDSVSPSIAFQMNITGADLEALGLSSRNIRTAMQVNANFEGSLEAYDVSASITDGIAVYGNESYLLGDLEILGHVRNDTTSLEINNPMLDLQLHSNASPVAFKNALFEYYEGYYSANSEELPVTDPVNVSLDADIRPAPIMENVFLPQLEELDTVKVTVDFRQEEKKMAASVAVPHIRYFGSEIDSLAFQLRSNRDELIFDFGLDSLSAGPLAIKKTTLQGKFSDQKLNIGFSSSYQQEKLIQIRSAITKEDGNLLVHLKPEDLVLNGKPWQINPSNRITIGDTIWNFENFILQQEGKYLRVGNDLDGTSKEHIGLEFKHFPLNTFTSYLNPVRELVSGIMNGTFVIEEPFSKTGMIADIGISDFSVLEVPLGQLSLDGQAIGNRKYRLDLAIKDGIADLDLYGNYVARETGASLDFNLFLNKIEMEVLEAFSQEALKNTSGSFSGAIKVGGTPAAPLYEGTIDFDQAAFTVAMLSTPYLIPDEQLRLSHEGIFFNDFQVLDYQKNALTLDGNVLTESLLNPQFDLSFDAQNFTALNSTEEDHDLFYGLGVFDATGSLTGTLEVPIVDMDLDVKEETKMTYVIPRATLEVQEREGVVVFVNKENPDRILTRREGSTEEISFSGFEFHSYITLEKNATFTVVLDQETGDHLQASGAGDLLFDVYSNGRTTLSGRVEINDGYYEMSLYDLVTRRFDLMDGSSVVWAGDPLDADLNIRAVYEVEASASALMAPQITGADIEVRNRFRQELPFLVYLYISGELTEPKISFGLDMPEDEQGAIGGQVYGRVQQINQQKNELNKQVFSLLVLNRFFPGSGSDGSRGGTLSFARDNLNEAVSDQLNMFSDQLIGETGINLNFGLDTYTDYQGEGPEERTQLDITAEKALLDDRLIVSVGSEVALQGRPVDEPTPLIGNLSIEYLLTADGRFRLEAFRRQSYENIIDGQLVISGLALIFSQEFNKFNELWDEIVKDEQKKQEKSN